MLDFGPADPSEDIEDPLMISLESLNLPQSRLGSGTLGPAVGLDEVAAPGLGGLRTSPRIAGTM